MRYYVDIECSNAAFDDDPNAEVARILRDLAKHVERGNGDERRLQDSNGNHVGYGAYYRSRAASGGAISNRRGAPLQRR